MGGVRDFEGFETENFGSNCDSLESQNGVAGHMVQ